MPRPVARLLLLAAVLGAFGLAACGSDDEGGGRSTLPSQSRPVTLTGGSTTLAIDPQTAGVLEDNAITLGAVPPASLEGEAVRFPITSGTVDAGTLGGSVTQHGGLRFASDAAAVELRDLRLNTKTRQVTAEAGRGRLPVFNLDQTQLEGGLTQARLQARLDGTGLVALLTPQAAGALNRALKVSIFTPNLIIGDVSIAATTA